jgi:hypothetical protein
MKAIVVKNPFIQFVLENLKWLELRSYRTHHRGDLLLVAGRSFHDGHCILDGQDMECLEAIRLLWHQDKTLASGKAVCVVNLKDCRPMTLEDEAAACHRWQAGGWVWEFDNLRLIHRFEVLGKQGFLNVPDELIQFQNL